MEGLFGYGTTEGGNKLREEDEKAKDREEVVEISV